MNNFSIEIKFKKNREFKETKVNTRRIQKNNVVTLTLISLLMLTPILLFSVSARSYEPPIESVLNKLGFTNITLENIETFSPGLYNITLLAEFSGYHSRNVLSYYFVKTNEYQTIFSGLEGVISNSLGYTIPTISKTFIATNQFGLSMLSSKYRYFTEHFHNPDFPEQHAKVYVNLDDPNMFLVGFENCNGRGIKRNYNDMIFSMKLINPQKIKVTRSLEIPNYDQTVTVTAHLTQKSYYNKSIVISYRTDSGKWINQKMDQKDGVYISEIPAQKYNTNVNYKVHFPNKIREFETSTVYSYIVGDFISPIISKIIQTPLSLNNKESVKVSVNVFEPKNASGVRNVTLK
ncbi:hypothetical protein KJN74_04150, partial [Candidatus Bathyarchaeota archaeon]|nr:hypothetical protein [Candidatus Bathyarchaeota archaeon]